jgi:hypothetical protein
MGGKGRPVWLLLLRVDVISLSLSLSLSLSALFFRRRFSAPVTLPALQPWDPAEPPPKAELALSLVLLEPRAADVPAWKRPVLVPKMCLAGVVGTGTGAGAATGVGLGR